MIKSACQWLHCWWLWVFSDAFTNLFVLGNNTTYLIIIKITSGWAMAGEIHCYSHKLGRILVFWWIGDKVELQRKSSASLTEARQHVSTRALAPTTCRLATVEKVRLRGLQQSSASEDTAMATTTTVFFSRRRTEKSVLSSARVTTEALLGVSDHSFGSESDPVTADGCLKGTGNPAVEEWIGGWRPEQREPAALLTPRLQEHLLEW